MTNHPDRTENDGSETTSEARKVLDDRGPRTGPWTLFVDRHGYLWFEEYAGDTKPLLVLNGHMFAIFGVWDYYQLTQSAKAKRLFDGGVTLLTPSPRLPRGRGCKERRSRARARQRRLRSDRARNRSRARKRGRGAPSLRDHPREARALRLLRQRSGHPGHRAAGCAAMPVPKKPKLCARGAPPLDPRGNGVKPQGVSILATRNPR